MSDNGGITTTVQMLVRNLLASSAFHFGVTEATRGRPAQFERWAASSGSWQYERGRQAALAIRGFAAMDRRTQTAALVRGIEKGWIV
jgi:hypothetical protein